MAKENKRIAIYIRVSTLNQAREGYSLEAQEKLLESGVMIESMKYLNRMQIRAFLGRILNIVLI